MKLDLESVLQSNKEYSLSCEVKVFKNGDLETTEQYKVQFTTGESPKTLIPENIVSAYPYDGMSNFYPHELGTEKGFAEFVKYQPTVMNFEGYSMSRPIKQNSFTQKHNTIDYSQNALHARFTSSDGESFLTYCKMDSETRRFIWDMPASKLQKNKLYKLEIIANNAVDINYPIYTLYFRVSKYSTFTEKVNDYYQNRSISTDNVNAEGAIIQLGNAAAQEAFSEDELSQCVVIQSTIPNQWYNSVMKTIHEFANEYYIDPLKDRYHKLKLNDFDEVYVSLGNSTAGSGSKSIPQSNYFNNRNVELEHKTVNETSFLSGNYITNASNLVIRDKALKLYAKDFIYTKDFAMQERIKMDSEYGQDAVDFQYKYLVFKKIEELEFVLPSSHIITVGYRIPGNNSANATKIFKLQY